MDTYRDDAAWEQGGDQELDCEDAAVAQESGAAEHRGRQARIGQRGERGKGCEGDRPVRPPAAASRNDPDLPNWEGSSSRTMSVMAHTQLLSITEAQLAGGRTTVTTFILTWNPVK